MIKTLIAALTTSMASLSFATEISIIPDPVEMTQREGAFVFSKDTNIVAKGSAADEADKLVNLLEPAMGYTLRTSRAVPRNGNAVTLTIDSELREQLGSEGYTLAVEQDLIAIIAADRKGLYYGIQTLRQVLPTQIFSHVEARAVKWSVPCVKITDYPRFMWRGVLLDPARHFIPIEDMRKFMDAMAVHKLNRLQLHLTDDQGWRLEIKKYPKLTEIGAWRNETLIGHYSKKPWTFDGKKHGGFYSQEEMCEIIRYAEARNITIVPEIEMPGHFQAAIASYPWLGVYPEKQKNIGLRTYWGVNHNILAPRPEGVQFCKDVLTEVMDIFPSEFIHIGGDEAKKDQWKASPEIQDMIKDKGLNNEHELQSSFTKEMDEFISSKGRRLIGWDEILQGGLAKGATVMSWRGEAGGITAANLGHDVVMATTSHTYFDYLQGPANKEPLGIGGHLTLERVYRYEPVPKAFSVDKAKHVLGSQCQLWGEYINNEKHREYMAFPRVSAFSEVVWSAKKARVSSQFMKRLDTHLCRLEAAGVNYRNPDNR